jgi:serine/threonine protein kinase
MAAVVVHLADLSDQQPQLLDTVPPRPSTHSVLKPLLAAGELPDQFGRYRIIKRLGRGGMGAVYLAHDSQLDRHVALKVPHFTKDDGPETLERFRREARAAATIEHPNICPVYDVGEVEGVHYLTMAYIPGKPLSAFLNPDRPLPSRQVAALLRKLALALAEAHRLGIVHRDLKPSNIIINQRKEPVLLDFGLARRVKQKDARLTQCDTLMGTPAYMPPEQVRGEVAAMGPACDIYSLGIILYELLAGRLPFEGPPPVIIALVLTREPEPPSRHRADLDPRLEAICLKAMPKKVEDRYATMGLLAADLTEYLRTSGSLAEAPPKSGTQLACPSPKPDMSERREGKNQVSQLFAELVDQKQLISAGARRPQTLPKRWKPPARFWLVVGGVAPLMLLLALARSFIIKQGDNPVLRVLFKPNADQLRAAARRPTGPNLLRDASFEDPDAMDWKLESWRNSKVVQSPGVARVGVARHGIRAAVLTADKADDIRLWQCVPVKSNTKYLFCGWVKAKDVVLAEKGRKVGANLSIWATVYYDYERWSESVTGTNDWTYLGLIFDSGDRTEVHVAVRLGHRWSTVTGTAWFDDLYLGELGDAGR